MKCIEDEIPFELPEGWEWCRLNKLFHVCSAKRVRQSDWREEGVPFYRAREIVKLSDNGFVENELFISEEHYIRVKEECGVPQSGDLMVSGVGTIGKIYIVNETDCFYYKDASVLCFENRTGIVNSDFARILLESSFLQAQMKDNSKGTTVDTITISAAMNYLCLLPPLKEQENIVQAVKNACIYTEEIQNNQDNLQILISKTKSKILDLAIRGQLVPQSPDDEPASVLLERIRAEKEKLIKAGKIKRDKKESTIFKGEDNSYYETIGKNTVCIDEEIPFDIPDRWTWCRLQSISSILTDGTHKAPEYSDSGYMFLSSKNVTSGKIDWENVMYIPEYLHEELYGRLAPAKDDILLAKNGTTGVAAVVDHEEVFDIYVSLALIRIINNMIFPEYILHTIGSSYIQNYFNSSLKGIGVPNLHLEHIRKTLIPIPTYTEQKLIAEKIKHILFKIDDISNALL